MSQPTKIKLYVARHAESSLNATPDIICGQSLGIGLSPIGPDQAWQLGKDLHAAGIVPDLLYSSDAVRARLTAGYALRAMDCERPPITDSNLRELSQGALEGTSRKVFYTPAQEAIIAKDPWNFAADRAESINMVIARTRAYLQRVVNDANRLPHPNVTALTFGHGYWTRILAGSILDWSTHKMRSYKTPNCSVSQFSYDSQLWHTDFIGKNAADLA